MYNVVSYWCGQGWSTGKGWLVVWCSPLDGPPHSIVCSVVQIAEQSVLDGPPYSMVQTME